MEKAECPLLLKTEDIHILSSTSRSIGSIVQVVCNNITVATLKCSSDVKWNGTVPTCLQGDEISNKPGEEIKVETIIIIVWVLGGVLLFSLLVLLTVILTARHKGGARRSTRQSIFTVSAEGRRVGGDNPAFSTEHEGTNWSLHTNTERLPPSYREAMMDRPPRLEPSRVQSNTPQDERSARYTQEYPSCFWEEEPPPPYSLFVDNRYTNSRIINVERTNSNRMTIVQSPRRSRNRDRIISNQLPTQSNDHSNPPNNNQTAHCNAQIHHTSSSSSSQTQQPNHSTRTTARAQIHNSSRSSEQHNSSNRSCSLPHIDQPNSMPQTSRTMTNGGVYTSYRCGTIQASAPLARLEIEYV